MDGLGGRDSSLGMTTRDVKALISPAVSRRDLESYVFECGLFFLQNGRKRATARHMVDIKRILGESCLNLSTGCDATKDANKT